METTSNRTFQHRKIGRKIWGVLRFTFEMNSTGNNDKAKAFITGGPGFIGRQLVKQLIQGGYYCRCLVKRNSSVNELKDSGGGPY